MKKTYFEFNNEWSELSFGYLTNISNILIKIVKKWEQIGN